MCFKCCSIVACQPRYHEAITDGPTARKCGCSVRVRSSSTSQVKHFYFPRIKNKNKVIHRLKNLKKGHK